MRRGKTHHVRVGCALLGLEEDDLVLAADGARLLGAWQLDARRVSKQSKDSKQARNNVRGCLCLRGMLVVPGRRIGVHRVFVRRLQDIAGNTLIATLLADNLLAAHGAELRERIPRVEAGSRKGAGETNRWILADLGRHTGCVADGGSDLVAHDAGRGRLFSERAGSAGKEQLVVVPVLAGEQQVGAGAVSWDSTEAAAHSPLGAEAEEDLLAGVLVFLLDFGGRCHGGW